MNEVQIDVGALLKSEDRIVRGVLGAAAGSVRSTTKALERKIEDATRAAVPGKLWRAWSSKAYPRTGIAQEPVGTIYLNGRDRTQGALKFFTEPGAIRGKRGQYLAVPTPSAGPRGRARDLTPGEWERRTGVRLRFVYRGGGKPSLLVADGGTTVNRRGVQGAFRPLTGRRKAIDDKRGFRRGETTVVIFVLLPLVRFRNSLALNPLIEASEGELTREFFANLRSVSG